MSRLHTALGCTIHNPQTPLGWVLALLHSLRLAQAWIRFCLHSPMTSSTSASKGVHRKAIFPPHLHMRHFKRAYRADDVTQAGFPTQTWPVYYKPHPRLPPRLFAPLTLRFYNVLPHRSQLLCRQVAATHRIPFKACLCDCLLCQPDRLEVLAHQASNLESGVL